MRNTMFLSMMFGFVQLTQLQAAFEIPVMVSTFLISV